MRYSSKSSVLAVALLLSGAAVFGSACGGSGGDDRSTAPAAGSGNTSGGAANVAGGTAAVGGSSSTAGSGGAVATCDSSKACCATTVCTCPYPAGDGTASLIANLEDGMTKFKPATVMAAAGRWDFSRDQSTGTVTPAMGTTGLIAESPGANGTMKALHVTGKDLTGWGAALAAVLSNGCPFDASKYGGISFWAKGTSTVAEGTNKLLVLVGNPEYAPKPGGFCDDKAVPADQSCFSRHRVAIDLTPEYKKYIVAWEDLKAPTFYQTGKAFSPNRIDDIVFNASGPLPEKLPAASFDFWIDELEFVPIGTKGNITTSPTGAGGSGGASAGSGGANAGTGGAAAGSGGAAAGTGGSGT